MEIVFVYNVVVGSSLVAVTIMKTVLEVPF